MNKTQIGDITEHIFILYCLQKEIPISKPIGNNLPYDFIIEVNNKLLKIQVKTSYIPKQSNGNTIVFKTISSSKNYNEIISTNYINKIDYFVTILNSKNNLPLFIKAEENLPAECPICITDNPHKNQRDYKNYTFEKVFGLLV